MKTSKFLAIILISGFVIGSAGIIPMIMIADEGQRQYEASKKKIHVPWFGDDLVFSDDTKNAKVEIYAKE